MILKSMEFFNINYKSNVLNVKIIIYYIKISVIKDVAKIVWIVGLLNKIKHLKYLQNVFNVDQIFMDQ